MELILSKDEVVKILLDWAHPMFPGKFNKVTVSDMNEYSTRGQAEFSFEEPNIATATDPETK